MEATETKKDQVDVFRTQIRIPTELADKIKDYGKRTGANINSTIGILLDMGLRVMDAQLIQIQK